MQDVPWFKKERNLPSGQMSSGQLLDNWEGAGSGCALTCESHRVSATRAGSQVNSKPGSSLLPETSRRGPEQKPKIFPENEAVAFLGVK